MHIQGSGTLANNVAVEEGVTCLMSSDSELLSLKAGPQGMNMLLLVRVCMRVCICMYISSMCRTLCLTPTTHSSETIMWMSSGQKHAARFQRTCTYDIVI